MRLILPVSLLVAAVVMACVLLAGRGQADAGPDRVDQAGVTIRTDQPVPEEHGRHVIRCRIANGTGRPILYTGYAVDAPLYRIQYFEQGQWVGHNTALMCGTGLGTRELPPGESTNVTVYVTEMGLTLRVGLGFRVKGDPSETELVAWSNPIGIPAG